MEEKKNDALDVETKAAPKKLAATMAAAAPASGESTTNAKADPAPSPPAPKAKAKAGDVVTYWDGEAKVARHAVMVEVDASDVASLKIIMPATRATREKPRGGAGVAKVEGIKFSAEPAKGCWGIG